MIKKNWTFKTLVLFLNVFCASSVAWAQLKTDGPFSVETGEYKYAAQVHTDILTDRETELWGRVFWPTRKDNRKVPTQIPLIVFLHGNHGTCGIGALPRRDNIQTYTDTGQCPEGYVVTPNHEGYNYIAEQLASYGYLVVSINANRGITAGMGVSGDGGLNLARGRLILKHLELFHYWHKTGSVPQSLSSNADLFLGKIDFGNVGLMGHSRGGEGVRAAYNLYYETGSPWVSKIPQMYIKGIFEIAAVDGQTSRTLNADNVVWNQLIPVCDGDVSSLEGIRPFNRMMQTPTTVMNGQKSVYIVYGANHNFFNTEWQESDSNGCNYHDSLWSKTDWKSERQQFIAKKIVVDFFRAHVGSFSYKIIDALNPLNTTNAEILAITQIERDFTVNPSLSTQLRFDDFVSDSTDIIRESSEGVTFAQQRGSLSLSGQLRIGWKKQADPSQPNFLTLSRQMVVDISQMQTLDFRFSLLGRAQVQSPINFEVQLIDAAGSVTAPISLSNFATKKFNSFSGALYQTIRIPIKQFKGVNLKQLKSVRFRFLQPDQGEVYLAHVRFSHKGTKTKWAPSFENTAISQKKYDLDYPHQAVNNSSQQTEQMASSYSQAGNDTRVFFQNQRNKITKVRLVSSKTHSNNVDVAITFSSPQSFKIQNSLPVLEIAGKVFDRSVIGYKNGESNITFFMPFNDFMAIRNEQAVFKIFSYENLFEAWMFDNTLSSIGINN